MEGYGHNFRAPKVDIHQFSMIPKAEIPRSSFRMSSQHKTTLSASNLTPFFVQEILPGDSFAVRMTAFIRMTTAIVPILDNMDFETWYFFVPCRLTWSHWVNFMGEQDITPTDSISYTIPQCVSPAGGFVANTVMDYFGLPTTGQTGSGALVSVNALPLRAYALIFNQWFRDQNLDNAMGLGATNNPLDIGDGPDPASNYYNVNVRKRHDYFTSCLPWTQKGGVAVTLPLGTSATVKTSGSQLYFGGNPALQLYQSVGGSNVPTNVQLGAGASGDLAFNATSFTGTGFAYPGNLYADLSTATAATINSIRLAFQTQKLLERDARGGTRYTEIIRSHFGVLSPDARLQRPEYLGGGRTPVNMSPVPQTGGTGGSGTSTPLGYLAGVGTSVAHDHSFRQSFTEHGYVIGLCTVRRDNAYQQGMRRLWTRSTRYDFYFPVFAMLGEQAVRNDEIFVSGSTSPGVDAAPFGYQERWAEYRYFPSLITGGFKSYGAAPLDYWHLATHFTSLPVLNSSFINDDTVTSVERVTAIGSAEPYQQFLCDFLFDIRAARPMPLYSVPGLVDHF